MNTNTNRREKVFSSIMIGLMVSAIAASAMVIRPASGGPPWWNLDWEFRKPLTINHLNVTADLINFPVLIDFEDADLAAKAQPSGNDIAFTDNNGQKLDHEIEFYNGTDGRLVAWIRLPLLSSTADTIIYMYYGNPDAFNQEDATQVWDSNYMMTQHFNERYEVGECRFWGMIAQDALPQSVVLDHLINLPNSLKTMGATNPDGWGLGYYNNTEPIIRRGEPAANIDPNFNVAAQEVAASGGQIGIGHVRKSASPPYNIPDPHPFNRTKMGETWTFAHHGVIDKAVLVQLIGAAYLAANPPQYGNDTSTYNDSELYFIYILKCIEENPGDVRKGIAQAVTTLAAESPSYNMNFVFSDGTTLWAFRRGDSTHLVYYYYNSASPVYSAVASQYPTSSQGSWVALNNYNLVELNRTGPPLVINDIRGYAPTDHFDSTANKNDGVAANGVVISTEGKINGGDLFDGVDDYIRVNDSSTLDGDGNWTQMTVEFWVKSTKDNQAATIILSKRETGMSPFNSSYQIGFNSAPANSQLFWGLYLDSGYGEAPYGTCPTLVTNQWYYVVGTFNSPSINLYLNGTLVSSFSKAGKILSSDKVPLRIGCRGNSGALERFLTGGLDEVRISNVSRSADWILTSFRNQNDPTHFSIVGSEEVNQSTTIRISPATTDAVLGADYAIYVEVTNAVDLYAWEFQLNYNPTILNLTSCSIVEGGLDEPTQTYYNLTDTVNGHVWWAVSTIRPTTTGISYPQHAIFELHYRTRATGTSELGLYGTILSDSNGTSIAHEVVNGSITVAGAIDLTVTNVNVLDLGCVIYANDTYNGGDYYCPVEVTIRNIGASPAPAFYVKLEVYWINGSLLEASKEEYSAGLAAGTSAIINFTDDFHPVHTGYYRLTATVDSQSEISESDETNNALTLGGKYVTVIGDVNGDGVVNILDGVIVSLAWTASTGDPQWNIKADVNHDGHINLLDGTRVSLHWGQTS